MKNSILLRKLYNSRLTREISKRIFKNQIKKNAADDLNKSLVNVDQMFHHFESWLNVEEKTVNY